MAESAARRARRVRWRVASRDRHAKANEEEWYGALAEGFSAETTAGDLASRLLAECDVRFERALELLDPPSSGSGE